MPKTPDLQSEPGEDDNGGSTDRDTDETGNGDSDLYVLALHRELGDREITRERGRGDWWPWEVRSEICWRKKVGIKEVGERDERETNSFFLINFVKKI